ncbi:hypothetical protein J2Z83_000099 [Virgibacillus natechei]|uniref:Uncharacterized protein n=1 Tax=Virgibacillus natechei TaxID=1216297 RepID=A0ABS4IAQ6_9BACI|nr:hypothetical protein [Virgibacillus natechei]MBP1968007.1 hypothetical protein [Virgibacillus natechei]UZD14710.1 hypothetical protein OLD84_09505 [Virgibacillus natechei]
MKLIYKMNNYFFDEDTILLSDALWFYALVPSSMIIVLIMLGGLT